MFDVFCFFFFFRLKMTEKDNYRSKLRTPKKEIKTEPQLWENPSPSYDFSALLGYSLNTPSPNKKKVHGVSEAQACSSSHKSGYFLRTPSPFKQNQRSPLKMGSGIKQESSSTLCPQKPGPGMDLFGNRSLLDNIPLPEWDEHFLDNFQADLLFGIGSDDIDGLVRSPLKSPKSFLANSPLKRSPALSPFKNPLLTSSPKVSPNSLSFLAKTPDLAGGRLHTRQRKLFLSSPEHSSSAPSKSSDWPLPLPFSSFNESASSLFSDGQETTTSIQSISAYLKNLDDEEHDDDYQVMSPVGLDIQCASTHSAKKSTGKGKRRSTSFKKSKSSYSPSSSCTDQTGTSRSVNLSTDINAKKVKVEPQFTLLRPHTEIGNNQICLRMTSRTPPNKVKISRDFSQIQTLPSKEQLRIVRNRFRETLNKAVEEIMEKQKMKQAKSDEKVADTALRSALQRPVLAQPEYYTSSTSAYVNTGPHCTKPTSKKRK